jgi:hypothetical protein
MYEGRRIVEHPDAASAGEKVSTSQVPNLRALPSRDAKLEKIEMQVDLKTIDVRRHSLDPPGSRQRGNVGDARVIWLEESHGLGHPFELTRGQEQVDV